MNPVLWCNRIIKLGFYLLFILVPLILTPWNYELFEYNKMMVTYGLTVIIVGAWLLKMVYLKEIRIAKTPFDIPILAFLSSQLLSSLFSMDPHVSWFGYYSRFNGGMLSIISYVLLYYAFVSNFGETIRPRDNKTVRKNDDSSSDLTVLPSYRLLTISLATAVAISLYGVAERLGIDKNLWVQDVQNRVFSTLGQPNWLAAYLVALMPLAWSFALKSQQEKNHISWSLSSVFWVLVSILFFLVLLLTRSRSGLLGFAVADIVFWGLLFLTRSDLVNRSHAEKVSPFQAKQLVFPFIICHLAFGIIVFLNGTYIPKIDRYFSLQGWKERFTQSTMKQSGNETISETKASDYTAPLLETGGTQSSIIRKYVWQGAVNAWKSSTKTLLIGTGTETFAFAFYQFRPAGHNMTSEWDFLYNKAHNEYLNYLATTGIFGIGSYLLFIGAFIWWLLKRYQCISASMRQRKNVDTTDAIDALTPALFAGWVSVLVTNFFGFSVVIVQLFLFLFPAMAVVSYQSWRTLPFKLTPRVSKWISFTVLLASLVLLVLLSRMWWADVLFAQGYRLSRSELYAQAQPVTQRAIAINPGEPLYHDDYSTTLAALTAMAVEQKQATIAAALAKQALTESDRAITISPKNVNFWKSRTKIFYSFSTFDQEFNPAAITALTRAWELSPNDPKIIYNLAILYGRQNDNTKAIALLEQAINLKPNYRDAYFALHVFYKEVGNTQKAREVAETYLQKVDPNDPDFQSRLQ